MGAGASLAELYLRVSVAINGTFVFVFVFGNLTIAEWPLMEPFSRSSKH